MSSKKKIQISKTNNSRLLVVDFEYDVEVLGVVKKIPNITFYDGSKKLYGMRKTWHLKNTPENLVGALLVLGKSNIVELVLHPDIKQECAVALELYKKQRTREKAVDDAIKGVGVDSYDYQSITPATLYPYQKYGFHFINASDGRCIVADEPGLGKTIQTLLYASYNNLKTLVICPATPKEKWKAEVEKWSDKKAYVCYSKKSFTDADIVDNDFFIVNYHMLFKRTKNTKDEFGNIISSMQHDNKFLDKLTKFVEEGMFDCVIVDEAHRMANSKTLWTKYILNTLINIPHRIPVTGTPISKTPMDYFNLLKFVDPFTWNSQWKFGMRYCDGKPNQFGNYGGYDFSGKSNVEELHNITKKYILRRKKEDVLKELPPKIPIRVPIKLDESQLAEYEKLERGFSAINSHDVRRFTTAISLHHSYDMIDELLEADQKVVIFSSYRFPEDDIRKKYGDKVLSIHGEIPTKKRFAIAEQFQNDPKIRIIFGTIQAMGESIELTASSNGIMLDLPWTQRDFKQASDRMHRISQEDSVSVWIPLCENTIDEVMYEMLVEDMKTADKIIDGVDYEDTSSKSIMQDVVKMIEKKYKDA